jgi:hypothetical protein
MYSPSEKNLIELLAANRGRRLNSLTIVSMSYQGRRPTHARRSVVSTLNLLAKKMRKNKEKIRIMKTERRGPYPVEFWVESSAS